MGDMGGPFPGKSGNEPLKCGAPFAQVQQLGSAGRRLQQLEVSAQFTRSEITYPLGSSLPIEGGAGSLCFGISLPTRAWGSRARWSCE